MGMLHTLRRAAACIAIGALAMTAPTAYAQQERAIEDESIYDLLVDRFFNGTIVNDEQVDTQNPASFAGGDFAGLAEKVSYIQSLGFTTAAIGSVFATDTYDGYMVTSYTELEPHFGTQQELQHVVETFHKKQIRVMPDVRLNRVSANHEWLAQHPTWGTVVDNVVQWDYTNAQFVAALREAIVQFQQTYEFGALRFTETTNVPAPVLNDIIAALRDVTPNIQIVSNEATTAHVDAALNEAHVDVWSRMFAQPSQPTSELAQLVTSQASVAAVDTLTSPRLTHKAAEANVFPPTRIKVAMGALLTMPVVPMMTYGTEISMNGATAAQSHQIQNFKVDEEIISYIADVQTVRNKSAALRTGAFELLHEQDGFIVFTRSNDEETWVVAINNTGETQNYAVPASMFHESKELHGLFEKDIVRVDEQGQYNLVVDREIVELYQVKEEKGFNVTYMGVMAFVYVIFIAFIWLLIRRAKRPTAT